MKYDLQQFAELIKEFKVVYGAGGIQHRSNPDSWRNDWEAFLVKNNREFINPYTDNLKMFNASMLGFKENGDPYTMTELVRVNEQKWAILYKQTEENDFHFIKNSDLLLFYLDSSAGFGTFTEFCKNFDTFKKPIIIIRNVSRLSLPHWVGWRRYNSLVIDKSAIEFSNLLEAKQFFINYFKFKE